MIVIICDATETIGYGHLKRCLVLASVYRKLGVLVTFLMRDAAPVVKHLLKNQGMELVVSDHGDYRSYLFENKALVQLVIIDHYEIDADFEKPVFEILPVVVVDDLCRAHWCDLLVDQTLSRKIVDYENKLYHPSVQTLLGIQYALIDPVYKGIRTNGDKKNILVSFGATDPGQAALRVLNILEQSMNHKGLVFHLPLSSMSPCLDALEKYMDKSSLEIRLYRDLPDLSYLYERCGIAIGAPGTSLLERIYCGLLNLTVVVAENQREVSQNISRRGGAVCLGEIKALDPSQLTRTLTRMIDSWAFGELQKKAMGLVDGEGAVRIIRQTLALISVETLRPANKDDLEIVYNWQHEPGARQYSGNTNPPTKKEHRAWFETALSSNTINLHIIEWSRIPIGYIRLDQRNGKEEISILIAQKFQGYGFAKRSLLQMLQNEKREYSAVVHRENKASVGLFESLGFHCNGTGEYGVYSTF